VPRALHGSFRAPLLIPYLDVTEELFPHLTRTPAQLCTEELLVFSEVSIDLHYLCEGSVLVFDYSHDLNHM